ncbi:MAG: hypothetical protein JKY11_04120 [Alphaproteobacteria bacterium]|nr:hypothetical protein [Alphaproteobacteria bacterium]
MSRQPNINHNVFDHFTVLQDVDHVSLKGRIFEVSDVGAETQYILIGFDKHQHSGFQYSYGEGEHNILHGDFSSFVIRSVAFDEDTWGVSVSDGGVGSFEGVNQEAFLSVATEIIWAAPQSSLPLLVTVDPVVDASELSVQSSTGFEI